VDGLRTRALSGEDAGSGTYAVERVDGGAGKPGRDRSSGDLAVLSI
jgi:hypothetical protein